MIFILLLAASDPASLPASEPASASAPVEEAPPPVLTPRQRDLFKPAVFVFLTGVGAAVVSVPVSLALGSWIGSLSPNLVGALLPSLLLLAIIPPIAITVAAYLVATHLNPGGNTRFVPPLLVSIGLQLIGILSAALSGVSVGNPASVVVFTAVEAVIIPAGVALTIGLGWRASQPAPLAAVLPPPRAIGYTDGRRDVISPVFSVGF